MLEVFDTSEQDLSNGLKGDTLERKIINVDEKKKHKKTAPHTKQTRKLLLIQLNILI